MSPAASSGISALLKDYRLFAGARLWTALALMLLGAIAEGFGLLMIVPLATIAMNGAESPLHDLAPWTASWTQDQRLTIALSLFLGAMAARSLLLFGRDTLLAKLAADYEASLRLRSAATLANRGWTFASRIGQPRMQTLLLTEVPRSAEAIAFIQEIAVGASMLLVQLVLTCLLSPGLTLVAILILGAGSVIAVRFTRRGVLSGIEMTDAMEASAGSGFRLHAGLKAALAQGTVPAFLNEYGSSLGRTAGQSSRFVRDYSLAQHGAAFGAALAAGLLLLVGVRVLSLPFPILLASLVLFARMSGPAQQLQTNAVRAAAYAPAFAAIEGLLGKLDWTIPQSTPDHPLEWHLLEIKDAGFDHHAGHGVEHASMRLQRGEWMGIRGASGAGKTTLVDLVAGLISPQRGTILVDGNELQDRLDAWRASIAYVGQEGSVFSDSLRGNLLAEGSMATDDELWRMLELVGLSERIRALPGGLDENVGDRGSQLSGGERQRLVIVRALLRRPTLLILDEATAALDPDAEAELLGRLKELEPRPAALVVAHRESTLKHCDSVLAIQHGAPAR